MLLVTKKNGVAKQTMLHGQRNTILASKILLVFPNLIQSLLIVFNIIFLFMCLLFFVVVVVVIGLVFKYLKGQHNVYEVIENAFRSCNASNGVLAKYESGEDQVVLNKVKKHWFICNIAGHCLGGMRFGIEVKDRNNDTTNFIDGAFNPQIQPTPSNNSCNSYFIISKKWRVIENFLPFGIGLLLLLN